MTGELTPKPGETSAQFKERVLKAQSDLAAQRPQPSAPRIETPAEPPTVTTSTPNDTQPKVTVSVPSAPAPSSAEPAKPAAEVPQPTPSKEDKVDPLEWARNKGLKSPEDIARSLRTLETEFHRRNQVRPATPAPSAPPPPPEAYRPAPPPAPYEPPPYQPAPRYRPQPPRQVVQEIAETYNLDPADAERLLPLIDDMTEAKVQARMRKVDERTVKVEREQARNSEMFRLMQDPVFQNPEVQFELHRILQEEPRIFEFEPAPYTYAFNQALVNIARRYTGRSLESTPSSENPSLSTRPPTPLGSGSGSSSRPGPGPVTPDSFNTLSVEKKREVLTSMGVRPTL